MMDDFERRVQAEIDRLNAAEFPRARRARQMRGATIRALAEATVGNRPWTGADGVLGPKRPAMVVSEKVFYDKLYWHKHPLVQEVIDNVVAIYRERLTAEQEEARQSKSAWLFNKEFEAAEVLFNKAHELLKLPHIAKKTKRVEGEGGTTIILDATNGPVFNAAVNMARAASDLARRSLGLPTDTTRSELTGAAGGPVKTQEVGRVHGGAEHVAAVARILVEAGAVELQPAGQGSDAAADEVHPA